MADYCDDLEKAELHLHLEGSVEPETLLELDPALSMEEIRDACYFAVFQGFIRAYIWVNKRLSSPEHYAIAARHLLKRLSDENVEYVELNLSVGMMLWKEQDFEAIFRELRDEAQVSPVEVHWIFDAIRQFGREHVRRVAELAVEHAAEGVVALGIGGDELRAPADLFIDEFEFARSQGLAAVPHSGETGGPEAMWQALSLNPARIGHGIAAAQDERLMRYLRENDIPLEISITSNIATGAVPSYEAHPIRKLFDAGVPIVLNTDDPALFHTTLSNEYRLAAERYGFTPKELAQLAENSFRYALAR